MTTYLIRNWDQLYENSRSRRVGKLDWVPVPNKHDGEGFCIVMAHPKAAEIYAAWTLILQVASKCSQRGTLVRDDGRPHNATSLAIKTRGRAEWFTLALDLLASDDVGWLEAVENTSKSPANSTECHPDVTRVSPEYHPSVTQVTIEGNGREGNGMELGKGHVPQEKQIEMPGVQQRMTRPTIEQVKLLFAKTGMTEIEATKFFNYYESNGWRVGRNPMKSLPHAVANWKLRINENRNQHSQRAPSRNEGTYNAGKAASYESKCL